MEYNIAMTKRKDISLEELSVELSPTMSGGAREFVVKLVTDGVEFLRGRLVTERHNDATLVAFETEDHPLDNVGARRAYPPESVLEHMSDVDRKRMIAKVAVTSTIFLVGATAAQHAYRKRRKAEAKKS